MGQRSFRPLRLQRFCDQGLSIAASFGCSSPLSKRASPYRGTGARPAKPADRTRRSHARFLLVGLAFIVLASAANFGQPAWSGTDHGKPAVTSSIISGLVTTVKKGEYLTVRTEEEREQAVMITEATRFLDARGKAARASAIVEGSAVRIRTSESHGKWLALEVSLTNGSANP